MHCEISTDFSQDAYKRIPCEAGCRYSSKCVLGGGKADFCLWEQMLMREKMVWGLMMS